MTAPILLILAGVIAYLNSFQGVFVFDDFENIVYNARIHTLDWPWAFVENTRRPFLYLTLAVNHALGGSDVLGYHLVNLIIHLGTGLLLFAVIRKISHSQTGWSNLGAFAISLIWLVHPLQTQSVTYIIQRAESLAGFLSVATFYAALKYWEKYSLGWLSLTVICAGLGVATKETALTAPLVILLYDAAFVSGSFRRAVSRHKALYLGLMVSWVIFLWLFLQTDLNLRPALQDYAHQGPTWTEYLLTQPSVILRYLKLAVWPSDLVFDYRWPAAQSLTEILYPAIVVLALLALFIQQYLRKNLLGFAGITFFVLLLPSSGLVALQDMIFEHRMYIALACVISIVAIGIDRALQKLRVPEAKRSVIALILLCGISSLLVLQTTRRNLVYHSEISLWTDVITKRPGNDRGYHNLAYAYYQNGDRVRAVKLYEQALTLNPHYLSAHFGLANTLYELGRKEDAIAGYLRCVELNPDFTEGWNNLGDTYLQISRRDEAKEAFQQALRTNPAYAPAYFNLGIIYEEEGELLKAQVAFERAGQIDPSLRSRRVRGP